MNVSHAVGIEVTRVFSTANCCERKIIAKRLREAQISHLRLAVFIMLPG